MKFVMLLRTPEDSVGGAPESGFHLCDADDADVALWRRLPHHHLACRDEAAREQVDNVFPPASPLACKLLPVELVAHHQITPTAPLKVALLEALVARHHLGLAVQACRQQEAIVVGRWEGRTAGFDWRRGRRQRHDVCLVVGVLASRERRKRRTCGEEQVCAETVICVNGRGGGERDLLIGRGRGHRKVGAGGGDDVHGCRACGGGTGGWRFVVELRGVLCLEARGVPAAKAETWTGPAKAQRVDSDGVPNGICLLSPSLRAYATLFLEVCPYKSLALGPRWVVGGLFDEGA